MGLTNKTKLIRTETGIELTDPAGAIYVFEITDVGDRGFSTFVPTVYYMDLSNVSWEPDNKSDLDIYIVPVIEGGLYGVRILIEKRG